MSRHDRTRYALLHMGPSILAAAATTIASAMVMMFTTISFFQKFGIILFATVGQATLGSFVVFLVLTDSFGPSHPTFLFDWVSERLFGKDEKHDDGKKDTEGDNVKRNRAKTYSFDDGDIYDEVYGFVNGKPLEEEENPNNITADQSDAGPEPNE